MSNSSCLTSLGKYLRRVFKKVLFMRTNYYSNDGGYSRMDSQDEQELVNLMEEKIDHPFREEIRVIVHKNDSDVEVDDRLNH